MSENFANEYLLQNKLSSESPDLQKRVHDTVFVLEDMLYSYLNRFKTFTDHSLMHSLNVLYYCNQLIGPEQIQKLTPEECYVLIMACYLHDIGMGINEKDYIQLSEAIPFGDYFQNNSQDDTARIIRDFHNEYSGLLIRKYAELFDFPSEELQYAVIQVSRGHRKTDLFDENEYPDLPVGSGTLHLAYLSAVVRLADEIDVASDRNPELLFDSSKLTQKRDIEVFGTHESIRSLKIEEERIILYTRPKSPEYVSLIQKLTDKIQKTLDYCRDVAEKRSGFRITQEQVVVLQDQD